jgi:hypothetical protein
MTKSHLRACPACARHVRVSEESCPFCGGGLDPAFRASPAPRSPGVRLTRAALFAFGTGTLAVAPGCSSSPSPSTGPADLADAANPFGNDAAYGSPAIETDAGDAGDGSEVNPFGNDAAYGGPAISDDAGDSSPASGDDAGDSSPPSGDDAGDATFLSDAAYGAAAVDSGND